MNFSLETVGMILISSFYGMGKPVILEFLQKQHDSRPEWYKAILAVANAALSEGAKAALKSATKLDDAAIADLQDAIQTSATANGITL